MVLLTLSQRIAHNNTHTPLFYALCYISFWVLRWFSFRFYLFLVTLGAPATAIAILFFSKFTHSRFLSSCDSLWCERARERTPNCFVVWQNFPYFMVSSARARSLTHSLTQTSQSVTMNKRRKMVDVVVAFFWFYYFVAIVGRKTDIQIQEYKWRVCQCHCHWWYDGDGIGCWRCCRCSLLLMLPTTQISLLLYY